MKRPNELYSWLIAFFTLGKYLLYRLRVRKSIPTCAKHYPEFLRVFSRVNGWDWKLRVLNPEKCPRDRPVIFACNHMKWDDPFMLFRAIYDATEGMVCSRFMMRDDFFEGLPKLGIVDFNELTVIMGAYHINRENVQLSQIKPFIKLLRSGLSFTMFPSRTRTRTGLFVEYRKGLDEPAAVSFFLDQTQRGKEPVSAGALPVARTYNPVTNKTVYAFGDLMELPAQAGREVQREFDYRLIGAMSELVEINAPQVVASLLYLHCLHGGGGRVAVGELVAQVRGVFDHLPSHRHVHPAVRENIEGEVRAALGYFADKKMLEHLGDVVRLNTDAILAAPVKDKQYRQHNPIKYLVNQVTHLPDVTAAVENAALGFPH